MSGEFFESMHASGRAAVLAGDHRCEEAPWVTGRWGHSVVALVDGDAAAALDELTRQAAGVAGPGHWQSARSGRADVTVRALAPFSHDDADPALVGRYGAALERAFAYSFDLSLDGLALSSAGVMLRCSDPTGAADAARARFGEALGPDGWLEDKVLSRGRDPFWYMTLLHFAGPIANRRGLVDWIEARHDLQLGVMRIDTLSLCRWDLDDLGMAPTVLGSVRATSGIGGDTA